MKDLSTIKTHGFIKIGHPDHIQSLQDKGLIYSNTLEFFRNLEKEDIERKDGREGARSSVKGTDLKVFLPNSETPIPINFTKIRFHEYNAEELLTHIFCLYVVKDEHVTGRPFMDDRNRRFGGKILFIHNPGEFLKRFDEAVKGKFSYNCEVVKYYDDNVSHKHLTVFHKPDFFSYQSEFRFHIKEKSQAPLVFEIGSISDISMIIDVENLNQLNLKPL